MRLRENLAADAVIVLVTLIWGSTFVVGKDILDEWPPVKYMALRLAVASALLALIFRRRLAELSRATWGAGAVLGVLIGAGLGGQAAGLVYTSPARSAFITAFTTPLVPFVSLALLRVRPSPGNLVGVALASAGGAVMLAPGLNEGGAASFGDLLTLGCTLVFATHMTLMSRYAREHDALRLTVVQIWVAAALLVAVWLAVELSVDVLGVPLPRPLARNAGPLAWGPRVAWQFAYMVVVATLLSFLLWTWGQARMSATHAAIIFSLEPVFATALAVAWRGAGEWPGGYFNLGASLILAGILVSELRLPGERGDESVVVEDEGEGA